jgi:hypothetical protein
LLHCGDAAGTILRRYEQRIASGGRHPGHFDRDALPRLRQLLAAGAYEPLDLGVPVLRVDTTTAAEYLPDFETIAGFVRSHIPPYSGSVEVRP